MKKVAILQSNYIPWRGYFDLIASVDEFIFFDDTQYTKRDWRNRNLIKTPNGLQWLTVPVIVKGKYFQQIRETKINGFEWAPKHWRAIQTNYRKSQYFQEISKILEPFYFDYKPETISELNQNLIKVVLEYLLIETKISNSSDFPFAEGKSERLIQICKSSSATEYISGPSAKDYIEVNKFAECGISVNWFDYDNFPIYKQLWGEFNTNVSILDVLFNCGPNSRSKLRN